jgi:hypothetical protein
MDEFDLSDPHILRAGIIPYIKSPSTNNVFFIFGLDEGIASLSDFGGTREYFDKDVYELALREYNEETIGLLEMITVEDLKNKSRVIVDETLIKKEEKCALFFYPFPSDYPVIEKMDIFKRRAMPGDETKAIVFLSKEQTIQALEQPDAKIGDTKMFLFHPKIRNMLLSNLNNIKF